MDLTTGLVVGLVAELLEEVLDLAPCEVYAGFHTGVLVLLHSGVQAGLLEHFSWILVQLHVALLERLPDGVHLKSLSELHEGPVLDGSIWVHLGLVLVGLRSQVHAGLLLVVPAASLSLSEDLLEEVQIGSSLVLFGHLLEEAYAPQLKFLGDLLEGIHASELESGDLLEEVHAPEL